MAKAIKHSKIYRDIVEILESSPIPREGLVEKCVSRFGLKKDELTDRSAGSTQNILRSRIGTVINEMHARNLISLDESGRYYLVSDRPVIIRIEKCETEIIKALTEKNMTKHELRGRLKNIFGTDKTATTRDDDTLSTYMGQILKRLTAKKAIHLSDGLYILSPALSARADDLNAILTLRTEFLKKIHSNGGEFFENYFMSLLKRYTEKHGKKVLECFVTGGSSDGGIDGIMKTEDSLGFREITMVQTKNRTDIVSETDVRGFYGAVCAKRGTRGIYVTTADFHDGAIQFLEELDDCVGICGKQIFSMAAECSYGIKKHNNFFEIDIKVV